MTARNHFFFWSAAFAAFLGFVFVFKAVLLPFVLGIAVAYLLNPLVRQICKTGLSRGPAALVILFGFLIMVLAFFAALAPVLYKEVLELSEELPSYANKIWVLLEPLSQQLQNFIGQKNGAELQSLITDHAGSAFNVVNKVLKGIATGGRAVIDLISVAVLMPVVAYFMMKEWDNITNWAGDLMPRDRKQTIMDLLKKIDQKISGFVRGQISVALFLGLAYAITLSLIGLKYGFLIGLTSGLLSIIPMVGSVVGLIISILVAWFQAGDWIFVLMVAGVFLVGQLIEGNILTPKLVGGSVGLHPLWVFFALLAGGSLFGILGMLLAVPVAAVAGVLLAFVISQYKASSYFKGQPPTKKKKNKSKNAKKGTTNTA